jgi:hypothetical protein
MPNFLRVDYIPFFELVNRYSRACHPAASLLVYSPRRFPMYGLAGLVVLVLDIIAIVDCLKSNADTVKKLLWILAILFLPLVGMLLYFLLERGK